MLKKVMDVLVGAGENEFDAISAEPIDDPNLKTVTTFPEVSPKLANSKPMRLVPRGVVVDDLASGFFDTFLSGWVQFFINPQKRRRVFDFHESNRIEVGFGRFCAFKSLPAFCMC